MSVRTLARTALSGALALAALAALAQTQTLLVTDSARNGGFSGIHKIDLKTGKEIGYVGGISLRHAQAIAILPGSATALVGDDEGIKAMDVASGACMSLVKSTAALGGWVKALRFNPADGDLYAVVAPNPIMYKVVRLSGATGAIKNVSGLKSIDYTAPLTLGFSTFGSVEVIDGYNSMAFRDLYTPTLASISSTSKKNWSFAAFRCANDELIADTFGYVGEYEKGGFERGSQIEHAGNGTMFGATDGLNGQIYMLTYEGPLVGLRTFDTKADFPSLVNVAFLPYFKHDTLTGVALCVR